MDEYENNYEYLFGGDWNMRINDKKIFIKFIKEYNGIKVKNSRCIRYKKKEKLIII